MSYVRVCAEGYDDFRFDLDYLLDAYEFGFSTPNLEAWCLGCPRTDKATFQRLCKMKQDLYDAVEEEKSRREQR
jgi:hypothetical protein